jgi:Bacterial archaeo-eukaryotic release factor family 2
MELHFVKELLDGPGEFATVYLDVSHDTPEADREVALRWAGARAELADRGADAPTLDALERAVLDAEPAVGRAGQVLIGRSGAVLLDRRLPAPPEPPTASWGAVPDLLPLLLGLPEPVTALVVRVDETGGEILLAGPGAGHGAGGRPAGEVHPGEYPAHKVRGGGMSHLNMQERVEESWRRNAAALAERVDALVSATAARVLVLAGDPPSRSRLREALSARAAGIAADVDHNSGKIDDELAAAVDRAVLDAVTARRHAVLDRYDQARGRPDGLAVDGLEPVLSALRAEQVDVLLLDGDAPPLAEVWITETLNLLATDPDELRAMGAEPIGRARADAAVLRAAAGSGASFQPLAGGRTGLVGHEATDGVAALLRYPLLPS